VIQAAITDIICLAVAAEYPLRTFDEELLHTIYFFQFWLTSFFSYQECFDFFSPSTRTSTDKLLFIPFLESSLEFRAGNRHSFFDVFAEELTFCFFSKHHAEAIFGVIFEQGVSPSRTFLIGISGKRSKRSAAAINGAAARGVSNHHVFAEELSDKAVIRGLAASSASTAHFHVRHEEAHALHGIKRIDVRLIGDILIKVIGAFLLSKLALGLDHLKSEVLGLRILREGHLIGHTLGSAETAADAVHRGDLNAELKSFGRR